MLNKEIENKGRMGKCVHKLSLEAHIDIPETYSQLKLLNGKGEFLRDKILKFRVTSEEKNQIQQYAIDLGLTLSDYVRSATLDNNFIPTRIDRLTYDELARARGDLGRLGGLLKMWLTNSKDNPYARLGNRTQFVISQDVNRIIEIQEEIVEIARRLL